MSLQSPDHPLTDRLPEHGLAHLQKQLPAIPVDRSARLRSLSRILQPLADVSQATVVICWEPMGQGFCWHDSWGITIDDASPESEFTSDIVANAESVALSGQPDIFIGPEEGLPEEFQSLAVPDPLIRDLVLYHRQLVVPIFVDGKVLAVLELFQVNDLPEAYLWSIDHVNSLQRIIESWLSHSRWTDTDLRAKQQVNELVGGAHENPRDVQTNGTQANGTQASMAEAADHDEVDAATSVNVAALGYVANVPHQADAPADAADDESLAEDESLHTYANDLGDNADDVYDDVDVDEGVDEGVDHYDEPADDSDDMYLDEQFDEDPEQHSQSEARDEALDAAMHQLQVQQRALRLTQIVGRNLHETNTAYDVAGELHYFFGEGRVSVGVFRGQRCQIRAISNQQVFDSRSAVVVALQRLAIKCVQTRRALWHPEQSGTLPPDLVRLFDAYYEAADTQSIALLPLIQWQEPSSDPNDLSAVVLDRAARPGKVVGVVIVEGLSHPLAQSEILPLWEMVQQPVTNAMANARQHNGLFMMPVWKTMGQFADLFRGHHRNKALAVVAIALITITGLVITPADFRLRCDGVIQPSQRSKIYAQTEGVVSELLVADGDWVEQGQVLMKLSNPQLSAEIADVEGKLRETRQKLKTSRLQRLMGEFDDPIERQENVRQSAGYEAALDKIQQQYDLLLEKQAQLQVTSPVAGQIVGWDLPRRLGARPVQPGQRLLTVADPKSNWELELKLADKRSGYLRDAAHQPDSAGLKTTYVLASNPTDVHQGTVREVARSADVDQEQGNIVRVYVDVGPQGGTEHSAPRPGTEVIAHIHAGRASLGYCKLYEFFDWVKRLWFKYA